jgi:segregation and condensation protein B
MAVTDDKTIIEALVFSSEGSLDLTRMKKVLGHLDEAGVEAIVAALNADYESQGHAFRIRKVGGGYRMFTLDDFHPWLQKLTQTRRDARLSPAAMETLAIIAYKQPVTRADIESIRGVQAR